MSEGKLSLPSSKPSSRIKTIAKEVTLIKKFKTFTSIWNILTSSHSILPFDFQAETFTLQLSFASLEQINEVNIAWWKLPLIDKHKMKKFYNIETVLFEENHRCMKLEQIFCVKLLCAKHSCIHDEPLRKYSKKVHLFTPSSMKFKFVM